MGIDFLFLLSVLSYCIVEVVVFGVSVKNVPERGGVEVFFEVWRRGDALCDR